MCDIKNTVLLIEPRIINELPKIIEEYHKFLGDNWNYVFYCGKGTTEHWKNLLNSYVELRELEVANFDSASKYSFFMKQVKLWESLYGDFVLTIQGDTWPMNIEPYTIDYFVKLNKSYIGGNMNFVWNELKRENCYFQYYNFNGGLSLRKRNDMIKIISTFPVKCLEEGIIWSDHMESDPEDVYFTIGCQRLGLSLGDDEESSHFAIHKIMKKEFFGIHQPDNSIKEELYNSFPQLKTEADFL